MSYNKIPFFWLKYVNFLFHIFNSNKSIYINSTFNKNIDQKISYLQVQNIVL